MTDCTFGVDGTEPEHQDEHARAFQEYMLRGPSKAMGKGGGSRASSRTDAPKTAKAYHGRPMEALPPAVSDPGGDRRFESPTRGSHPCGHGPNSSSRHRRSSGLFRRLHRLFTNSVRDWVEVDDQMLQVAHSISNLRHRCWLASRALALRREGEDGDDNDDLQGRLQKPKEGTESGSAWMRHLKREDRYQGSTVSQLPESLLQLTLDDVLVQHEKMLALLRRLASELAREMDAAGRRLDDLMLHQLESEGTILEDGGGSYCDTWTQEEEEDEYRVQESVEMFAACARELHRKQGLARILLDSTNDAILCMGTSGHEDYETNDMHGISDTDDKETDAGTDGMFPSIGGSDSLLSPSRTRTPRGVARAVARAWARDSPESELFVHRGLIDRIVSASRGARSMTVT